MNATQTINAIFEIDQFSPSEHGYGVDCEDMTFSFERSGMQASGQFVRIKEELSWQITYHVDDCNFDLEHIMENGVENICFHLPENYWSSTSYQNGKLVEIKIAPIHTLAGKVYLFTPINGLPLFEMKTSEQIPSTITSEDLPQA